MSTPSLELLNKLIAKPSVTPDDAGCLDLIRERLDACGFRTEILQFDDVTNLWATLGDSGPLFAFAGHTDVVPTGTLSDWTSDPFSPSVRGEYLYGRGAADMKSSLAAMVVAVERVVHSNMKLNGRIGFLLTSDEEGIAINGTQKVIAELERRKIKIDWCLVGEPSSIESLGDQIRVGRRGSLNGRLTVNGTQGHVAYPDKADNPIHAATAALNELSEQQWDAGNEFYPPTSFQISNINSGTGAENVIPGTLEAKFNFRFSTESTQTSLQSRVEQILNKHGLDFVVDWHLSGAPFLTATGELLKCTRNAIEKTLGVETIASTGGGTSDGRFIAPTGAEVIEFGPVNETIHQIDERIRVGEVDQLTDAYEAILRELLD